MDSEWEVIAELLTQQQAELETLRSVISEMIQVGPVHDIDPDKGYRIKLGEDEEGAPYLSPWKPHPETSKTSIPLKVGQMVGTLNPNGDPRQGILLPGGYSNDHETPNTDMEANVFQDAGVRIQIKGGKLQISAENSIEITVGGVTHIISGDGVDTQGGKVTHNSKNVGSTHTHGGISPGPANTKGPN
ncbi:Phage P2 baseplate assembly protein gpV [Pseudovibrio ascidiaceicola]|uniref:Phage P2 baseplate assembly protein gpV n=1 Tax=Pseudovibrio ascidiaceicola TaxID=285279 RepID=A0A1I4E289_9HYPH|nr:phage baseplate assembly protein V [Pseudovibrio ascidiaceicola]SFK99289.1 Phage P2 baseplate assembly protein gpV [Pseudovibrio ascidiaceicola]